MFLIFSMALHWKKLFQSRQTPPFPCLSPPRLCWATYLGKLCGGGFCVCFLTFPNYETIDSYNVLSGYSHAVLTWLLVGQQPFSCDSAWELPLGVLVSPDLCSLPLQTSKQGMLASGVTGLRAPKTRSRITTLNHHPYADTLLCILGVAQILHWPLLRYVQQMSSQWVYPSLSKFCQHCKYHLLLYLREGRKITFLLLFSGMPHCKACFSPPWISRAFIPLAKFCPLATFCLGQALEHVAHLMRLMAISPRLMDRNSRSLSELLWTGCGGKALWSRP